MGYPERMMPVYGLCLEIGKPDSGLNFLKQYNEEKRKQGHRPVQDHVSQGFEQALPRKIRRKEFHENNRRNEEEAGGTDQ